MESQIFLSAREAERATYGPWGISATQEDCDGCGYVIMEGDKVRPNGNGGHMCAQCGEGE